MKREGAAPLARLFSVGNGEPDARRSRVMMAQAAAAAGVYTSPQPLVAHQQVQVLGEVRVPELMLHMRAQTPNPAAILTRLQACWPADSTQGCQMRQEKSLGFEV